MTELVRRDPLGNIAFGLPEDLQPENKPWGLYALLGVEQTVSREELQQVYRRLAFEHHPDRAQGLSEAERKLREERFKTLKDAADILLDDGGKLGEEHSQRRHYDEVSGLEGYFDGFISRGNERTHKLSEIMILQMRAKKKYAQVERKITEKEPQYSDLKQRLQDSSIPKEEKKKVVKQLQDLAAKAAGLTPEARAEIKKVREEQEQRFEHRQRDFLDRFAENPYPCLAKILDIFYVGDGTVVFGTEPRKMHFGMTAHDEKKEVLELILGGDCYLAGFRQVHFKAPEAQVEIKDPYLTGIVHVVKGTVQVDYDASSYGEVIRARAPEVHAPRGFVKQGDLYVPESFATSDWQHRKPALDIAVQNGSVSLTLRSREISKSSYAPLIYRGLEERIYNILPIYSNKIIKKY